MRSLIRIAFAQRLHNYAWTYLCFYVDHLSRWQCMYISDYVFSVLAFHIYCAHWLFIYNGKIWLGLNSNWKMLKRFKIHTYIYIEACGAETINWSSFLKFHFFFFPSFYYRSENRLFWNAFHFVWFCVFFCAFSFRPLLPFYINSITMISRTATKTTTSTIETKTIILCVYCMHKNTWKIYITAIVIAQTHAYR